MEKLYYMGILYTEGPKPFGKIGVIQLTKSKAEYKNRCQRLRHRMFGQVLERDIPILAENYQIAIID